MWVLFGLMFMFLQHNETCVVLASLQGIISRIRLTSRTSLIQFWLSEVHVCVIPILNAQVSPIVLTIECGVPNKILKMQIPNIIYKMQTMICKPVLRGCTMHIKNLKQVAKCPPPFNMICLVTQGNVVFCIILHFGVKCHTIEFFLKKMAYFIVKIT